MIVSDSRQECAKCRPFGGKVFSLPGTDPKYPALSVAVDGGRRHPGCTRTTSLYVPGYTKRPAQTSNPKGHEAGSGSAT